MSRGLDHVVHAVRDLDAAASLYRRLGFTVGPQHRDPWGTHAYIVQVPGFFIEILSVAGPEQGGSGSMSREFGDYHREFLREHEGLSLLGLESRDAAIDAETFRTAAIEVSAVARRERDVIGSGGAVAAAGLSCAFARDPLAPCAGFAACQHDVPDEVWNSALHQHANGVTGIAGVVLVAENPSDHHIFLSALVGERELLATSTGIAIMTPRGEIQVMDPPAYHSRFAVPAPNIGAGARIAALRLSVRDLTTTRNILGTSGFDRAAPLQRIVVAPDQAMGATLVFEAEQAPRR